MKGLLKKDYKITCLQKRYFTMIFLLGLVITYGSTSLFAVGYMTMIGAFFTISTLSYDEMNNGMSYLMAMPISREEYVKEKYIFGIALSFLFWVISVILSVVVCIMKKEMVNIPQLFESAGAIYLSAIMMLAVIFPFILKLGAEKGRMIAMGAIFAVAVTIYGLGKLFPEIANTAYWDQLLENRLLLAAAMCILIVIFVFILSVRISCNIMKKKEF